MAKTFPYTGGAKGAEYPNGVEACVGAICVNDRRDVLALESSKWAKPVFCGGHIRPGERAADAALRKAFEDVGIRGKKAEFLCHGEHFFSPPMFVRTIHEICLDFAVLAGNAEPAMLDGEIVSAKWMSIAEARKICVETWIYPLDILAAKLKGGDI
jgi:8-oxo-dGTP pyrophosphatase MutT (NUDIX family)